MDIKIGASYTIAEVYQLPRELAARCTSDRQDCTQCQNPKNVEGGLNGYLLGRTLYDTYDSITKSHSTEPVPHFVKRYLCKIRSYEYANDQKFQKITI